ncbi:hypothetical protein [Longimicrobium sp.]|uniref:hypothetical protein n=1 Tax=Longimicrobium sp. TaxID=2029185 RepID=UPI003B3A6454
MKADFTLWQAPARVVVMAAALLCAGCIDANESADAYRRDSQFAEQFVRDMHAGGLAGVRARIKPATLRDAGDPKTSFDIMMRALPAGPIDSLRPLDSDIELGRTRVSKLAYRVYGGRQAALVRLWIETTSSTQYVETVAVDDISAQVWPATPAPR